MLLDHTFQTASYIISIRLTALLYTGHDKMPHTAASNLGLDSLPKYLLKDFL